ncbi:2-phosphoglycolate phosphatase 2 [Wolffia australiana]
MAPTPQFSASSRFLCPRSAKDLLESVDVFLFDCDGVIWKGDKLIDGVPDALQSLRSWGKKLAFVTNNSSKSRKQYVKKFQELGLEVGEDEIFSSSFAAAMFLKMNDFPRDKKVYAVGEDGILEEMALAGYECLGGTQDGLKQVDFKANIKFEHDENVGAVIVGLDKYINYYKMQYATLCIRENRGCLFIATNRDSVGNLTDLQEWPGAGAMVSAICGATQKEPIVVGKPSTFLMDFMQDRFKVPTSRMCMVGDRLDTDILFGLNAGCKTLLVLSGVTNLHTLHDPANTIHPDYYTSTVSNIIDVMEI